MSEIKSHKSTVLVIEDNELSMKLIRTVLQIRGGYQVIEAKDAETGLEAACEHLPDIILMDIALPGMSGLEATQLIKSDPELAHIPVIAVTSSAMVGDEKKALKAGCDGFISKPIDVNTFVEDMEEIVCRKLH